MQNDREEQEDRETKKKNKHRKEKKKFFVFFFSPQPPDSLPCGASDLLILRTTLAPNSHGEGMRLPARTSRQILSHRARRGSGKNGGERRGSRDAETKEASPSGTIPPQISPSGAAGTSAFIQQDAVYPVRPAASAQLFNHARRLSGERYPKTTGSGARGGGLLIGAINLFSEIPQPPVFILQFKCAA